MIYTICFEFSVFLHEKKGETKTSTLFFFYLFISDIGYLSINYSVTDAKFLFMFWGKYLSLFSVFYIFKLVKNNH